MALPGARKLDAGSVGQPVEVRGAACSAGDWVVADADGVVVVGADRLDAVLVAGQQRADHEAAMFDDLRAGRTTIDLLGLKQRP